MRTDRLTFYDSKARSRGISTTLAIIGVMVVIVAAAAVSTSLYLRSNQKAGSLATIGSSTTSEITSSTSRLQILNGSTITTTSTTQVTTSSNSTNNENLTVVGSIPIDGGAFVYDSSDGLSYAFDPGTNNITVLNNLTVQENITLPSQVDGIAYSPPDIIYTWNNTMAPYSCGRFVCYTNETTYIYTINATTGKLLHGVIEHTGWETTNVISSDGKLFVDAYTNTGSGGCSFNRCSNGSLVVLPLSDPNQTVAAIPSAYGTYYAYDSARQYIFSSSGAIVSTVSDSIIDTIPAMSFGVAYNAQEEIVYGMNSSYYLQAINVTNIDAPQLLSSVYSPGGVLSGIVGATSHPGVYVFFWNAPVNNVYNFEGTSGNIPLVTLNLDVPSTDWLGTPAYNPTYDIFYAYDNGMTYVLGF
jgi:hypothetical protein